MYWLNQASGEDASALEAHYWCVGLMGQMLGELAFRGQLLARRPTGHGSFERRNNAAGASIAKWQL